MHYLLRVRHLEMHIIVIDSLLLILSFELKFFGANMFPYEDSEFVADSLYPEKRNHPSFFNINLAVVTDS